MPLLSFDKVLKIIGTILTILSYAIKMITGDSPTVPADEDAD